MSLTRPQVEALLAPLHPSRVRQVQGNAHLEAWDVRRHLLRVFGWGGWDFEVIDCTLVSERSKWDEQNPLKGRHTVVYRVLGRLVIKSPDGTVLARFEDGATGDAANQPSLGDAHDMAIKTAMSQALKRCAMNLGDRFGLGLYNGGRTEAVVGRSLAHEHTEPAGEVSEHVAGGELDERPAPVERVRPAEPQPDAWTGSDPTFVAEWRAALTDATDLDVLAALAADLKAAKATGQVTEEDYRTLGAEGKARREAITPDGGWPAVPEPGSAA